MTNATSWNTPELRKVNEVRHDNGNTIVHMRTEGADPAHPGSGAMALATPEESVTWQAGYYFASPHMGTADRRYLFTDLYNSGKLPNWDHGRQPDLFPRHIKRETMSKEDAERFEKTCAEFYDIVQYQKYLAQCGFGPRSLQHGAVLDEKRDPRPDLLDRQNNGNSKWGGALCVSKEVSRKNSAAVRFVVGWHFPNHVIEDTSSTNGNEPVKVVKRMGHEYVSRFTDATDVVKTLINGQAELYEPTVRFHDDLYSTTLPPRTADHLSSQLSTMIRCSWWTAAGDFGIWEGLGCCGIHTTDVAIYGSIPIALMFPSIEEHQLDLTRRFQREDGRVPHLFPCTFDHPNDAWYRTDMMAEFTLMVYRDFVWRGDRAFLDKFYPHCKKAILCMMATDQDNNGLPDALGADTTYDTWGMFGNTCFLSGLFLAALRALNAMAEIVGDTEITGNFESWYAKGRASYEKDLWNGKYLRLWRRVKEDDYDDGCMADQLAGQWYATMTGMGDLFDPAKIKKTLAGIMQHNFKPGRGLVNGAYPKGTTPPLQYFANYMVSEVWTGVEYAVASLLLYKNMHKEAQRILDDVYDRYVAAGGIWRHDECGPYYYRPMSVWSVLLGYQKFSYDAHKQEIGFLTEDKKHRSIFCIGTGWGIFERNGNTIKITCRYGTIGFKCLRFAARSKIARAPRMQIDGKQIAIEDCVRKPAALTIRTSEHVELTAGQSLKITIV